MSDIFVSYAAEDRQQAAVLAKLLEGLGWTVWWDRVIPTGRIFADVIKEELDSAKCVIVLWSSNSVSSPWVRREASAATDQQKLFPVLIEEVDPPWEFGELQACDLVSWDGQKEAGGFQRLVIDLKHLDGLQKRPTEETQVVANQPSRQSQSLSEPKRTESESSCTVEKLETHNELPEHVIETTRGNATQPDRVSQRLAAPNQASNETSLPVEGLKEHNNITERTAHPRLNKVGGIAGALFGLIQTIIVFSFAEQFLSYLFAILILLCWSVVGTLSGTSPTRIAVSAAGFLLGGFLWPLAFGKGGYLYEWNEFWWFVLGGAIGAAATSLVNLAIRKSLETSS